MTVTIQRICPKPTGRWPEITQLGALAPSRKSPPHPGRLKACDRKVIVSIGFFVRNLTFSVHTTTHKLQNRKLFMGQSLCQLYVHLTFSTKSRIPFIHPNMKDELHAYMAGILNRIQCPAMIINSMPDHVHILYRLSKTMSLAAVTEQIKKGSSKWMKKKVSPMRGQPFSWQIGYAAFSVSPSMITSTQQYITHQQTHHQTRSYRQEIEEFMRKYDVIEYDPDYFWR
jgi:putative transposase